MRRDAVPLYKTRHTAFVKGAQEMDDMSKKIAGLLGIDTGARPDTICHTHSNWFVYEDGDLYYRIPASDPCRKYGHTDPCGDCRNENKEKYSPKTAAGSGRRILVSQKWTNPVTKEREYLGLRDAVENYFALDNPQAPEGVQHGEKMIGGNGICKATYSTWLREIGAKSSIRPELRHDMLVDQINIDEERNRDQIKYFGTDADGNGIPDIFGHDLRASYCTQLMRNDIHPEKAITKTGHEDPETLNRYVAFVMGEIDSDEEKFFT